MTSTINGYDQTIVFKDACENITDIVFTGLNVKLSELINQFPAKQGGNTLTIYSDTVVADIPYINSLGTVIVARKVDITSLQDNSLKVRAPADDKPAIVECLILKTVKSGKVTPLKLSSIQIREGDMPLCIANENCGSLSIGILKADLNGPTSVMTGTTNDFLDLISRPAALNSLLASFAFATSLINKNDNESLTEAISVLRWICQSIYSCGNIPASHTELFCQASTLLQTINAPENWHYVGLLSSHFYSIQIDNYIKALEDYTNSYNQLMIQESSKELLTSISRTLSQTAKAEGIPTLVEFNQTNSNLENLRQSIVELANLFNEKVAMARFKSDLLINAINQEQIKKFVNDFLKTMFDAVMAGVEIADAVESDFKDAGKALGDLWKTSKEAFDTIKSVSKKYSQDKLMEASEEFLINNQNLINSVLMSEQIWFKINNPSTTDENIVFNPTLSTIDPDLVWDNYMAEVQCVFSNLSKTLKDDKLESVQVESNEYLASLQIMANYGKAFYAKIIAYNNQLCRAIVLKAKKDAIENVEEIWRTTEKLSTSQFETFAVIKAQLQYRINSIMRSIYVSWMLYRSVFLYKNFSEPLQIITMDSSIGDIRAVFSSISQWLNTALSEKTLPNSNAKLSITVPVVSNNTINPDSKNCFAVISPKTNLQKSTIIVSIPKVNNQFQDQIGSGEVAVWITSAEFVIKNIKPNASGYVPISFCTSGKYVSGFDNEPLHFITNSIRSHYSYKINNGEIAIIVPWQIDPGEYILPTPFTLWWIDIDNSCDTSDVDGIIFNFTTNLVFKN